MARYAYVRSGRKNRNLSVFLPRKSLVQHLFTTGINLKHDKRVKIIKTDTDNISQSVKSNGGGNPMEI